MTDFMAMQELVNNSDAIKKALDGLDKARRGNAIKLGHSIYNLADWVEHHIDTIENVLNLAAKIGEKP